MPSDFTDLRQLIAQVNDPDHQIKSATDAMEQLADGAAAALAKLDAVPPSPVPEEGERLVYRPRLGPGHGPWHEVTRVARVSIDDEPDLYEVATIAARPAPAEEDEGRCRPAGCRECCAPPNGYGVRPCPLRAPVEVEEPTADAWTDEKSTAAVRHHLMQLPEFEGQPGRAAWVAGRLVHRQLAADGLAIAPVPAPVEPCPETAANWAVLRTTRERPAPVEKTTGDGEASMVDWLDSILTSWPGADLAAMGLGPAATTHGVKLSDTLGRGEITDLAAYIASALSYPAPAQSSGDGLAKLRRAASLVRQIVEDHAEGDWRERVEGAEQWDDTLAAARAWVAESPAEETREGERVEGA